MKSGTMMQHLIPDSRIVILPLAQHGIMHERAEQVDKVVIDILCAMSVG